MNMRRIALVLAVVLSIFTANAADLNAPGQKIVTIRSEIIRGSETGKELRGKGLSEIMDGYWKAFEENRQNQKDSDGFQLGWSINFLLAINLRIKEMESSGENSQGLENLKKGARSLRALVLHLEQKMGITDRDTCEIIGANVEKVLPLLDLNKPTGEETPFVLN